MSPMMMLSRPCALVEPWQKVLVICLLFWPFYGGDQVYIQYIVLR